MICCVIVRKIKCGIPSWRNTEDTSKVFERPGGFQSMEDAYEKNVILFTDSGMLMLGFAI